jgi:hypothetical protein
VKKVFSCPRPNQTTYSYITLAVGLIFMIELDGQAWGVGKAFEKQSFYLPTNIPKQFCCI